ncbi:hypothetical protein BC629DRAFT_1447102 [Irpex lacteus]|nr:hypothetical protein BC629DRAFT_1447102 [Irpex lacteus]
MVSFICTNSPLFSSLCILRAHLYAPGNESQVNARKIASQSDKATAELVAAQAILQVTLKHNNLTLDNIRLRNLTQLEWLSTLGEEENWDDWRNLGTVQLGTLNMKSLFTSFQGLSRLVIQYYDYPFVLELQFIDRV